MPYVPSGVSSVRVLAVALGYFGKWTVLFGAFGVEAFEKGAGEDRLDASPPVAITFGAFRVE